MPTNDNGMIRLDVNDPKDVQYLVDTGYAWVSGPKTLQKIARLIVDGAVKRRPEKERPAVTAWLDSIAPIEEPEPELLNPLEGEEAVEPTSERGLTP